MSVTRTAARIVVALALAASPLELGACGSSVTTSTTCSQFLQMDSQTQETGVETLAAKTHGDAFKGPMGINNVVYDCQESPTKTLGALMGVS